ncbi:arsenite S-adenosylmethyltransferase [Botrimarina colliarenosi]|uniref:Arsenite S-adenosylmethyltransferase n=1 Tax=Botrimarina colliarenosi TaxID=2528001 RepID=A0A5C6AJQ2_9BACT|nr:arsenosugar biosynthesis arsenite methyltransferase ArsM [Botrimarina colliarenosi]TWT99727.1 arsenite S-adenosylmethyltransferase [Botrimarina colliarenosi]
MTYLDIVASVYRDVAQKPADNLCCVATAPRRYPGLRIPGIMHEMNYGCGSSVRPEDLSEGQRALYIGVGGGLEALELAYFTRRPGGVVAIDPVAEMREAAERNLALAAETNPWFDPAMVTILPGDALELPVADSEFDYVAQNCLFNIFRADHLERALSEARRVLKLRGRLAMSDPITPTPLPEHLTDDPRLRAACLSGCQTFDAYVRAITEVGFGQVEVRSRRPYRALDAAGYGLPSDVLLESIDVVAVNQPTPQDGPCVYTGRTATYTGADEAFEDGNGRTFPKGTPQAVCDKTAAALAALGRADLLITPPTWHYSGGGCC